MAGDWIKMRSELATHPKLKAIYNALVYGDDPGLLVYVCGSDALGIGAMPPSNESMTDRALRCVTDSALLDVTLCALLRVWSAVNAHCKVDGVDAILSPMQLFDVDSIAGFSGFGEAMKSAGWIDDSERNSLRFPNFLEWNQPACSRNVALTNSERQSRYRERYRQRKSTIPSSVTAVTKSNGDKIREDIDRQRSTSCSLFSEDALARTVTSANKVQPHNDADRRLLAVAGILSVTHFSEDWFRDAIQAALQSDASNPMAYLRRCLQEGAQQFGSNFDCLFKETRVPKAYYRAWEAQQNGKDNR